METVFSELQTLAEKLLTRPCADTPAGKPQTMYGYIRTERRSPDYRDACADLLNWWSASEGWQLGTVFCDRGVGSHVLIRPGFTGLLDVLRLPGAAGVVVVSGSHLSECAVISGRLTSTVRRTGSTIRILADELAEVTV
ncbi:hypothetical protein AB5J62_29900 [Amycolatopsis sp. cg5]|uniref:hypothetical protein n=1 Tax=Amycolatopsis sp. cg5 TaxID=3238802 RepID=UPI0035268621